DYIATAVNENDIIMIRGMDQLSTETARYITDTVAKLEQNDVRLAYLYDAIGKKQLNKEKEELNDIEFCDMFNTNGIFYQDIEQDLIEVVTNVMTETDQTDQYLIRRKEDLQSNFVYGNFGL